MAPITLSKQAFLKTPAAQKPGASYAKYINYITRARTKPAVSNVATLFNNGGLSPAELAQTRSGVNTQIAAAIAANNTAANVGDQQSQAQIDRAKQFALAMAGVSGNAHDQALADYQSAAQQIQSFGTGLTGAVHDEQQAEAKQASDQISAMTDGKASDAGYNLDDLHNALQYGHVTLPATSLAGQAANAAVNARAQADASAGNVGSIAQQYMAKQTDARNALLAQNASLQGQRPQLLQSAVSAATDAKRQQRALDVQIGTLQLQQAKTVADQAVAMTNLTGKLYVVKNGRAVPTSVAAPGSDAATTAGQNARATADRRVRVEIANTAAAARKAAAQTAADAKVTAAQTAADAKKAAAAITKTGKAASPGQRSSILKNSSAQANDLVKTTIARIWSLMPNQLTAPKGTNESDAVYNARHQQALTMWKTRQHEHRVQIVNRVARAITPQLQLLNYGPDQIQGWAQALVSGFIPRVSGQ